MNVRVRFHCASPAHHVLIRSHLGEEPLAVHSSPAAGLAGGVYRCFRAHLSPTHRKSSKSFTTRGVDGVLQHWPHPRSAPQRERHGQEEHLHIHALHLISDLHVASSILGPASVTLMVAGKYSRLMIHEGNFLSNSAGQLFLSNVAWALFHENGYKFLSGYFKSVVGSVSHLVAR